MEKYSDEELSRILSCAATEELVPGGGVGSQACIEQAASLSSMHSEIIDHSLRSDRYLVFDREFYGKKPGPEEILIWLISKGWA